jgi:hypothetical protein
LLFWKFGLNDPSRVIVPVWCSASLSIYNVSWTWQPPPPHLYPLCALLTCRPIHSCSLWMSFNFMCLS